MRYVHHCNAARRGRTPERTWSDCWNALTEKGYAAVSWLVALIGYCLTAFIWQTTDDTGMTFANVYESRVRLHSKDLTFTQEDSTSLALFLASIGTNIKTER